MVNRAVADPGATDDSDQASIHRVAELSLVQCPAQFAELAQAWVQLPEKQPELLFLSLSHAPDLPVPLRAVPSRDKSTHRQ